MERVFHRLFRMMLAAVCVVWSGSTGHAGTLPAGSLPVGQAMPGQTVCDWTVYAGQLYVTGSDAFSDICHCGAYCHAYATPPRRMGKMRGSRRLPQMIGHWRHGQAHSFGRARPRYDLFTSLARFQGVWRCVKRCGAARPVPLRPAAVRVVAAPLPASLWIMLTALIILGVARVARAGVRPT